MGLFRGFHNPLSEQAAPVAERCAGGRFLGFVTGFFGNAIGDRATASAGMLAVFAALVLVARRSGADPKNRRLTRAGPWLVIGALPLSQAILATYGRLPLDHAFRDDYAHYGYLWRSPSVAWRCSGADAAGAGGSAVCGRRAGLVSGIGERRFPAPADHRANSTRACHNGAAIVGF